MGQPSEGGVAYCPKGHALTPMNGYVMPTGYFACRLCQRLRRYGGLPTVTCLLCDEPFRMLGNHVLRHGVSIKEYGQRFPDAPTMADDLRAEWRVHASNKNLDRYGRTTVDGIELPWRDEYRVLRTIASFTRQRGRAPRPSDWPYSTNRHPSAKQVARMFGSFREALRQAGVWDMRRRKKMKKKTPYRNRASSREEVLAIRRRAAAGELLTALAREFGKDRSGIEDMVRGRTYADIGGPRTGPRSTRRRPAVG